MDVAICSIRFVLLEGRDALAEVLERRTREDLIHKPGVTRPDLSILPAA